MNTYIERELYITKKNCKTIKKTKNKQYLLFFMSIIYSFTIIN